MEFERKIREARDNSQRNGMQIKKSSGRKKGRRNNKLKNGKKGKKSIETINIRGKKKRWIKKRESKKNTKTKKSRKTLQTDNKGNISKQSAQNERSHQNTVFCPVEKASTLKWLYNQVYNFKKQLKRAQSQAETVKKKKEKKDVFKKDAAIVTDVVGGNLKEPTCYAKGR